MTEQKRAAVEYTQEELETMVKAVLNGATIGDVCNVSQDMLESLYSLGYNLYTSGNYKDAETVFSGLCLYDHNDPRFWMGLAGSRQANGKYQEAVDAYGLCSAMGALASPVPVLQAGMCYLKMGDREKAQGAFVVALSMGCRARQSLGHARHSRTSREVRFPCPTPLVFRSARSSWSLPAALR